MLDTMLRLGIHIVLRRIPLGNVDFSGEDSVESVDLFLEKSSRFLVVRCSSGELSIES